MKLPSRIVKLTDKGLNWKILLLIGAVSSGIFLYFIQPSSLIFLPPCLLHKFTGLYCPFCGGTRAMYYLLHGNFALAFRMNPLLIAALALSPLLYKCFLKSTHTFKYSRHIPIIFVTALFLYGVMRNIPVWIFSYLALP